MIGNHSIPVIANAILTGIIENPDTQKLLLDAMVTTSRMPRAGMRFYDKFGYVPADKESESVSKTLEYAYDDWCVAMVAKHLGDTALYSEFLQRAQSYKNIFNPANQFHQPKLNGAFLSPYDPREVTFHYTEANGWQYNFYVPHDVSGYIQLLSSEKHFTDMLDSLFMSNSGTTGRDQADITGLIGQYAHGNEPSHQMAYLYAYAGQAWKTQQRCNEILNNLYFNAPDGLSGNEDCGQMSAWYVLSSLGFYSVNPADGIFVFGCPQADKATIHLENGKTFTISTENRSINNPYIQEVKLNGKVYSKSFITYSDMMLGGELVFAMGSNPNKSFGAEPVNRPQSKIEEHVVQPNPYAVLSNGKIFQKKNTIELHSATVTPIEYRVLPVGIWKTYSKPIKVNTSCWVEFRNVGSKHTEMTQVIRRNTSRSVQLFQEYGAQYTAGGANGLVDGERGGADFRTGGWQGYQGTDFTAIVNLGKKQKIHKLALGCLQEARSWIWMPKYVEFWYSADGKEYFLLGKVENTTDDTILDAVLKDFVLDFAPVDARYVKVFAKNYGIIPNWHLGKGYDAYIFVDEIVVN
jgi:hypothetical protein